MHTLLATIATSPMAASVANRLNKIPTEFWWKAALALTVFVVAILVLRHVARMNKIALGLGAFLVLTTLGFNWIHERNEPSWATPVVQVVAGFFPGKVR